MGIPETCSRCTVKTFVIFDGQPWCRKHFLAATERTERELAADFRARGGTGLGPTP